MQSSGQCPRPKQQQLGCHRAATTTERLTVQSARSAVSRHYRALLLPPVRSRSVSPFEECRQTLGFAAGHTWISRSAHLERRLVLGLGPLRDGWALIEQELVHGRPGEFGNGRTPGLEPPGALWGPSSSPQRRGPSRHGPLRGSQSPGSATSRRLRQRTRPQSFGPSPVNAEIHRRSHAQASRTPPRAQQAVDIPRHNSYSYWNHFPHGPLHRDPISIPARRFSSFLAEEHPMHHLITGIQRSPPVVYDWMRCHLWKCFDELLAGHCPRSTRFSSLVGSRVERDEIATLVPLPTRPTSRPGQQRGPVRKGIYRSPFPIQFAPIPCRRAPIRPHKKPLTGISAGEGLLLCARRDSNP